MNTLLMLALVLIGAWVVITLLFGMINVLVHVLLLIGAVLFVAWAWRKLRGTDTPGTP